MNAETFVSIPRHRMASVLVRCAALAIVLVAAFIAVDQRWHPSPALTLLSITLLGVTMSVYLLTLTARRVEVHPDRLVVGGLLGARARTLDEVDRLAVNAPFVWDVLTPSSRAQVALRFTDGTAVRFEQRRLHHFQPLLDAVTPVLHARFETRLAQGASITLVDRARFPWALSVWMSMMLMLGVALASALALSGKHGLWIAALPIFASLYFLALLFRALDVRRAARRSSGVMLTRDGFCPLTELARNPDVLPQAPFRSLDGARGATIAWRDLRAVRAKGLTLRLTVAGRGRPVVLSPSTDHLLVLAKLLAVRVRPKMNDVRGLHAGS